MRRWKSLIREAIWVLALALVLAGSAYALRPHVLPFGLPEGDVDLADPTDADHAFISLDAAMRHFKEGTAVFADARSAPAFNAGHIPGALNLAPQAFDDWSSQVVAEISVDEMVIVYCDGPQCSLSDELAEKFEWLGYENVTVLKDGWGQWVANNMPVDTKGDP